MRLSLSSIGNVVLILIGITLSAIGVLDKLPVWSIWVGVVIIAASAAFLLFGSKSKESKSASSATVSQNISGIGISNSIQAGRDVKLRNNSSGDTP